MVVDAPAVLVTHLTEFIKEHASELLGRQEVHELLEQVKGTQPALVEELVPDLLSVGELQKVLGRLLAEGVPIRDLVTILEALADAARSGRDLDHLTGAARAALRRTISRQYARDGKLIAITLHPALEERLVSALEPTSQGLFPAVAPEMAQALLQKLAAALERAAVGGAQPVCLCSSRLRAPLQRLLGRSLAKLPVLAYNELEPGLSVEAVEAVNLDADQTL